MNESGTGLRRYESYKDSGVEWLGAVPSNWDVKPGLTCFKENKDRNNSLLEKTILSLSYGRIIIKPDEKMTGLVPASFENYQLVRPGDIIIRTTDLQNDQTSLRVGLAKDKGVITSAYLGLRCDPTINPAFIYRLLEGYDAWKIFYGMGSGLRQNIGFQDFKRIPIPLPPRFEQDRIVKFLDEKAAEIDAAIAKKECLFGLLQEQKSIIINQAVTRGLNLDAPIRDSGAEWIGHIPTHWDVVKMSWVCTSIRDGTHTPPPESDSEYRLLSVRNIIDGRFLTREDDRKMSLMAFKSLTRSYTVEVGDIVLALVGGTTGKSAVVDMDCSKISVQRSLGILRPDKRKILSSYLNFFLQAASTQRCIWDTATKYAAQPGIYLTDVSNIALALPPINEQKEIVMHCNEIDTQFQKLIDNTKKERRAIIEWRTTLISSVVTGKIKV